MKKKLLFLGLIATLMLVSCVQPQTTESQLGEVSPERVETVVFRDFGPEPLVIDIEQYTLQNETYRTAIWTGNLMQMTVMALQPGEDIGLELHTTTDQFLRVEQGSGLIMMGDSKDSLDFQRRVEDDFVILIPAGKWHNLLNDSDEPLKLYSIYTPVEHPHGTVHATREVGIEHDHDH